MIVRYKATEAERIAFEPDRSGELAAIVAAVRDEGVDLWIFPAKPGQAPQLRRNVPPGSGPGQWMGPLAVGNVETAEKPPEPEAEPEAEPKGRRSRKK